MAGRVLLMLAALAVLYGCGQASAPSEKRADFHSPDVNQGETIELSVTDPTVGYEYAFDCDIDDANGYDAPFLKQLTADSGPIGFSCPTPEAGTRKVGVKIRDEDGNVTEYTDTVEIGDEEARTGSMKPTEESQQQEARTESVKPADHTPGAVRVRVRNADGTTQTQLFEGEVLGAAPVWSPDGKKMAFMAGGQVYVMNSDGTGLTNLITNSTAE